MVVIISGGVVVKNPRIIAAPYQGALNLRIRRGRDGCENPSSAGFAIQLHLLS